MGSQASSLISCLFQGCCLAPEGGAPAYFWTLTPSRCGVVSTNHRSSGAHLVQGTLMLLPVGTIYHGTGKHHSVGKVQMSTQVFSHRQAKTETMGDKTAKADTRLTTGAEAR